MVHIKKKKKEQLGLLYTVNFALCKSLPNTDMEGRLKTPQLSEVLTWALSF